MTETRTDLLIQAKAKGFQDVQQQAANLIKAGAKAIQDQIKGYATLGKNSQAYKKEIQSVEKSLKAVAVQQLSALKAMEGVKKGTDLYNKLQESLEGINKEYDEIISKKTKLQEIFGGPSGGTGGGGSHPLTARDMSRGGFTQGFAQGAFGVNLQRGPGMWRQAAGMSMGTMARGFAGAPFGGVQGFTQGLAGIPGVGGMLAGQFSNVTGFAEGALELQRSRLASLPLFGGSGGSTSALARVEAERAKNVERTVYSKRVAYQTNKGLLEKNDVGMLAPGTGVGRGSGWNINKKREQTELFQSSQVDLDKAKAEINRKASKEASAIRNKPFAGLRQAGAELGGMSEQESMQFFSSVLQKSGGSFADAQKNNMVGTAFAAQTKYGISGDVSGSFLGAGRRGGIIGSEKNTGDELAMTISDALSLSLEGSEVQDYLAQMAQHMDEWKTTGIPLNPTSMNALSKSFSSMGFGGVRGAVVGQQFAGAAQNLTMSGVQDPMDLMMLQTVGGYKGGGMDKYLDAMEKLESLGGGKGIGNKEVNSMISQISKAGGGGDAGAWTVREAFGKKGIRMGVAESRLAVKAATNPESLSDDERAKLKGINAKMRAGEEGAPGDAAGLAQQAREAIKAYAPAVKKAAELQNKQNDIGDKFLGSVQKLQESAQNINTAFSTLASGGIKDATSAILNFTGAIDRAFAGSIR